MISAITNNPVTHLIVRITVGFFVLSLLFAVLPTWDVPDVLLTSIAWALNLIYSWDFLIPASTVSSIIAFVIVVEVGLALVYGFIAIARIIGFKGK